MKALAQVVFGAALTLGSVAAGQAADLRMPVKAMMSPQPAAQWINAFVGVTVVPDSVYGEAGAIVLLTVSEVDTAGKLTDDVEVDTTAHLGLQWRALDQRGGGGWATRSGAR